MMDAKESPENRTNEVNTLIMECGLVDPHLMSDPYSDTETYAKGKAKINYILTTQRIRQIITYTQVAPCHEWISSDRRALIIDMD